MRKAKKAKADASGGDPGAWPGTGVEEAEVKKKECSHEPPWPNNQAGKIPGSD